MPSRVQSDGYNRALVFLASALFFFGPAHPVRGADLAGALLAEGDRRAARVEALRVLQREPDHEEALAIVRETAGRRAVGAPEDRSRSPWAWLARGAVRFYQTQIGPAIGQRCSMHPSCSTYCAQALGRYGLAGIPMTADRLIRETDHVNHRIRPVRVNGVEKYYDPVEDHSLWFRRYRP